MSTNERMEYLGQLHKEIFSFLDLEECALAVGSFPYYGITSYSSDMGKRNTGVTSTNLYLVEASFEGTDFSKVGCSINDPMKRDIRAYRRQVAEIQVPIKDASFYEGYALFSCNIRWPANHAQRMRLSGWEGATEAIHSTHPDIVNVFKRSAFKVKDFLSKGGRQEDYIFELMVLCIIEHVVFDIYGKEELCLESRVPYLIRDHSEQLEKRGLPADSKKLVSKLKKFTRPLRKLRGISELSSRVLWRENMGWATGEKWEYRLNLLKYL